MKKEVKQLEKNSKKRNEETFKDISIKLKVEEEDKEVSLRSSWKNVSTSDREHLYSKINSLNSFFKKFNKKYGEKDIEIIAETDDGKTKVKSEIGDDKNKFILNTTKKEEVLLEISKRTGISASKLNNVFEFEEDD